MTTQNTANGKPATKHYTNVGIKYRGFLQHDNKYFDRTCPSCGGMYTSYTASACPKCRQPLTFITAPNGKVMSISEGTFKPLLSTDTQARMERNLLSRKRALPITYRFKMYSFVDDNGVIAPPPEHMHMKKGAIVEMIIINHPAEAEEYDSIKLQRPCVQLMHHIFTSYGDSVKVVSAPKVKAESTVAYRVDAAGNPVPVAPPFNIANASIADMENRIAEILAELNMRKGVQNAPAAPPAPAAAPANVAVAAADNDFPVDEALYDDGPSDADFAAYDDQPPF